MKTSLDFAPNRLYYGDCLEVLRGWPSECVDLVYLDPPFNSETNYNVLYGGGNGVPAQVRAFADTWHWDEAAAARMAAAERAPVNSCNCMRSSSLSSTMYRMFITVSITGMETVDHGTLSVSIPASSPVSFTQQQGQYLAFIYAYTKVNGRPPAQADMQRFFAVTAPSVHQMVLNLERRGLLRRTPRRARSLEVLVAPEHLPILR